MTKDELQYVILRIKDHIYDQFDVHNDAASEFMSFCEDFIEDKIKKVAGITNRDLFLTAIRTPSRDTSNYLECVIAFLIVHGGRHGAKALQPKFSVFPRINPAWDDICGKVFKPSNDKGVDLVVVSPKSGTHGMHITYIQVKHGTTEHGYRDTLGWNKFALATIRYRLKEGRHKIEETLKRWFPKRYESYSYGYCLYTSAPIIPSITKDAKGIRKPPNGATEIVIYDRSELAEDFEKCGIVSALEDDLGIFED
eukprot:CAMPEP_0184997318 /NCGR_PEP_ID=MMETSP1098-20130426/59179_1 /TAXON_ID=89044 /ORGANISM="Spumella elongata, Strain CCAP 955/1" /LENGTH=252 /DNA_ID=CAMNT_0027523939 /DNA_START=166 /DNA_END=927 /DNA_ORIENTATION=+